MRIGGIVQIRLRTPSERLVLENLNGRKIIEHVLDKIKKIRCLETVILAAPDDTEKNILSEIAARNGVKVFFGSEDVSARLIAAAQNENIDAIARFAAGAPFIDPKLANKLIEKHFDNNSDHTCGKGFPSGILPEIIGLDALRKAQTINPAKRYYYNIRENPEKFKIHCIDNGAGLESVKLDVTSPSDLRVANEMITALGGADADYKELMAHLPKILHKIIHSTENREEKRKFNKKLNSLELLTMADTLLSMPPDIRMDAHNLCNIKCKTCPQMFGDLSEKDYNATFRSEFAKNIKNIQIFTKTKENRYRKNPIPLSDESFRKIKSKLFPFAQRVSFGAYAEPFLNKNFIKMLGECKAEGLCTHFLTNGMVLNGEKVETLIDMEIDEISVSFDGASRKAFEEIRRGSDFNKIVSSLERLNKIKGKRAKSKPAVELDFTASAENIEELPKLVDLASTLGAGAIWVSNRYIMDFMDTRNSLFFCRDKAAEYLRRTKEKAAGLGISVGVSPVIENLVGNHSMRTVCNIPWTQVFISSSGNICLCACMYMMVAGNITERPFGEIWNSQDFKNLRKGFNGQVPLLAECKSCCTGNYIVKKNNINMFMSPAHTNS